MSVFDVYRREDYTIALSKQDPPQSLTKGAVGDLLSLMTAGRKNGMTTAYVGVHEGSLYALSTKNYPLVQISPWASMYTGRKPGDTANPLIESGPPSTSKDNSSGYEWTQKPHEMCCHGCEYHIDCMIGQHVVSSVVDDIVEEDRIYRSKLSLPSTSSSSGSTPTSLPSVFPDRSSPQQSSSKQQPQLPHYHHLEDYEERKTGFFYDGFGKFWKSYILVSSVIVYIYRDRMLTFYEVKVLPRWKQMMKKRAKAKKTKARIAAAARAEREKINREIRGRSDSLTSIGSFDADRYIKEKIDEQIYEKEQERKRQREQEEAEEKKRKEEEEETQKLANAAKEAEEKLTEKEEKVVVVKKKSSSTGLDLESFKQSKSRVLEISDHVLGKLKYF